MRDFALALPKLIYGVTAMSLRARRSSRPRRGNCHAVLAARLAGLAPYNLAGEPQHIRHRIEAGLLVLAAERGLHGTARENAAVFRDMSEFDPLAWSRENYFVIADDRPAAQRRKADIANRAQAGVAVTHADGMVFEGNPTAFRGASAEQKRGPGGCIDLHAMMHLDDLDIIFGTQRAGGLFGESGEEIDTEAHVSRVHDNRMLRGGLQPREMIGAQTRCADDVNDSRLGRQRREFDRRLR